MLFVFGVGVPLATASAHRAIAGNVTAKPLPCWPFASLRMAAAAPVPFARHGAARQRRIFYFCSHKEINNVVYGVDIGFLDFSSKKSQILFATLSQKDLTQSPILPRQRRD
ncbi:MAG: hypothetical protein ABSA62_16385 [Methyloceanibacter sp.]|jgi:hypothetical protein